MSGDHVSSLGSTAPATTGPTPAPAAAPAAPAGPAGPVDVRLVALTPDRSHLVLEDSGSRQFRLPVDTRLAAALRPTPTDRARTGQLEIALESQLSPREIQGRIRAGQGVEEVARAAGISAERVERYAGPVVAEREHVLEQVQRTPGRRSGSGATASLGELVAARLTEQGAATDATEWTARRADDESRWTVALTYLAGGRARTATWTFDPRGRVLSPADDEARWLVDEQATPRAGDDEAPAAVRRLASVPAGETPAEATDEVYDREADERPAAAQRSTARRPAVPAWDDIMFGPRRR